MNNEQRHNRIFDIIRKKYVTFTPEEFVRQNFVNHMVTNLQYPVGLICVEKKVSVNGMNQRVDILVYNRQGNPVMIVECKAPNIEISQETLEQAARYNLSLGVKFIALTNGKTNYCIKLDLSGQNHQLLAKFPLVEEVIN